MAPTLPRFYDHVVARHLATERQMVFLSGPRQVGKTTTAKEQADLYLSWDDPDHQRLIAAGPRAVADRLGLEKLSSRRPVVAFDELHKFGKWKNWLKGFFDVHGDACRIVVTGSSRLDVYRRGGDSLMGRYFLYRMHPFTVGELVRTDVPRAPVRPPRSLAEREFDALWEHGGFPEPFTRRTRAFSLRWRATRRGQLVREDLRDLTQIQELGQVGLLAELLHERSADPLVFSRLADDVHTGSDTVRRWVDALGLLHLGFLVRPWFRNVVKSLRKEPKWYLRDWSGIEDRGRRGETFVACHLLKAVEGWTDLGLGTCELRYLRDKAQREVDFLVVRDGKPWFLVEVKATDERLSPALAHFQEQTGAAHAFQVVLDRPFVDADCFTRKAPSVVPARTLLSQLL